MQATLTILIDGLTYASWLFIVAVGLTLVFGVLKILNIAHGSFYALGAYAAASFVGWAASLKLAPAFSLVAMLLAAVAVAALVAPVVERGLLRFFYGRDEVLLVLVTYALFLIMEDVTKLVWGANPYYVSEPYQLFGNLSLGVQTWVGYDFALVALAVIVGLAVWWGLNRTRQGKVVLAVIHSAEIAASMGVNVSRVYMGASVQPGVSVGVIILSFAVVIIGGLGSIEGAAVGALIVGLARSFAVHVAPVAELFSIYIVMAVVLMFRPEGLFQRTQARKI
jgi:branched-chain amino acid transport system permease protein